MLDLASIDASRINHPPSSSLRPFLCSEDATGCTVRTVKMDKIHLWSHSSRKCCSFPPQTPSSSTLLMDTSTRTGVSASRAHRTSARWWEQTQDFAELLHIQAPGRAMAKRRECVYQPAEESAAVSVPTQSTNMWLMGNAYFMSEQMAFLQSICISIQGNRLLVTKASAIRNRVFSD